jgi:hypothetical protein
MIVTLTRSVYIPYSNPVLQAYVGTLETQLSSLRNELSDVYKLQGQNTQKLLTMTEVSISITVLPLQARKS